MTTIKSDWEKFIRNYLECTVRVTRGGVIDTSREYFYGSAEHLVLDAGHYYPARRIPPQYHERTRGECYWNALSLTIENEGELRYVEGFATEGGTCEHHAWNIDRKGRVVDVTWSWGDKNQYNNPKGYFGIVFPIELVQLAIRVKSPSILWTYSGVIDDQFNAWPLLKEQYSPKRALSILREIETAQHSKRPR